MNADPMVTVSAYTVSRIPDDNPNAGIWGIRVEATGHGRWAVRHIGSCLTKSGEWEYEPIPSSRTDAWLAKTRWDNVDEAIDAAIAAEKTLQVNGKTAAELLGEPR